MKTILIIEDNEENRENIAEILTLSNYKVLTAVNGKDGIETAMAMHPDLIVCDIMMPSVDGCGVLHISHKNPETQNTPFIFLTSKSERSDFRTAMEMGADDYIIKPFAGNELLNAIEIRLNKVENLKKSFARDLKKIDNRTPDVSEGKSLENLIIDNHPNVYHKKHVIYKEGVHSRYLYYIVSGKVKTYKTHKNGKDLVMALYSEGDFFGYASLLDGTPHKENAEVIEDAEVVLIPKNDFDDLLKRNHSVTNKFIGMLAKNLAEKEQQFLGIAYNTLRKKVAEALVSLQKKFHTNKNEQYLIDISRDDLAAIAGTATESLVRTLSDFRVEKLIDIKNGKVIITNEQKLESLLR